MNSKYLHAKFKQRASTSAITFIEENKEVLQDGTAIIESAQNYFGKGLIGDHHLLPLGTLNFTPQHKVHEEDWNSLEEFPLEREIKEALFALNSHSAAGGDGWTNGFFQVAWEIIKDAIQSIWKGQHIPGYFTQTILLPLKKKPEASTWNDYRPISICTTLSKVLSEFVDLR